MEIHEFAVKWFAKFRDKKTNYIELVDHYMADDCDALGFVMDCGHTFAEKYGNAVYNCEELESIVMPDSSITRRKAFRKERGRLSRTSFTCECVPAVKAYPSDQRCGNSHLWLAEGN